MRFVFPGGCSCIPVRASRSGMADESDVESVSSAMSLDSSSSSCERDEASSSAVTSPVLALPLIRSADPAELHQYIRLKQKMVREAMVSRPGVVHFQRVPHGFTEQQLTRFFAKYGRITRVRLVGTRSKKYQGSSGPGEGRKRGRYVAYMEFARAEDAQTAVMDNQCNQLFHCAYLSPEQVPAGVFSPRPAPSPCDTPSKKRRHSQSPLKPVHRHATHRHHKKRALNTSPPIGAKRRKNAPQETATP